MDQELLTEGSALEEEDGSRSLAKSALRLLGQLCALLIVFFLLVVFWFFFVGEKREAYVSLRESCDGSAPSALVRIDSPRSPWGVLYANAEIPDGWEKDLQNGGIKIEGRLRINDEFHGPDGLFADNLSSLPFECFLDN